MTRAAKGSKAGRSGAAGFSWIAEWINEGKMDERAGRAGTRAEEEESSYLVVSQLANFQ